MADLSVQPKKRKTSPLIWLGLLIAALALILLLMRGCNHDGGTANTTGDSTSNKTDSGAIIGATSPNTVSGDTSQAGRTPGADDWDDLEKNAPNASYAEVTNKNINVRGNDNYGIYSLGEDVLFDNDKATIRKDAAQNLKEIAASINKRFNGGTLRVYGFTDSVGSKGYNKQLAEERAAAVRSWLASNAGIDSSHISLNPIGEGRPVASNNTAQGRQQNRRVEIIAKKAQ